ncbi:putative selenium metabolism hydrolase [Desulfonispora thiosulfatigenes DSM 11270]|uniref:Putative selenium metabolism hydrolase n=1 Tax=Desulfonispora thiosulfatigenes DSM 11270 TaxID=656914 RepID=A0A1W1VFK6_DESTI|nr:M20/M25/M40 family metallo-hydrolase [Desulfonispora thiosulfatigenes]SMB92086.1 putative selenium metabolism hydrolase [Desulfonispora thiosulfatigenes DSM 11270]
MTDIYTKVSQLAKQLKPEIVKFTQELIKIPSISGQEQDLAEVLLNKMAELKYDDFFRDDLGNIVGIIKGTEPGPTIMYNSHMDHVSPGNYSNWEGYDPYGGKIDICEISNQEKTLTELTECIHGRAASDVKAGHACQIYAGFILLKLRDMGYKIKGNFMYTGVVQEEPASLIGMTYLIDKTFKEKGLDYDAVVSSEATSLKLYLGHRGHVDLLVTVYGRTSHGSAPWLGVNAVYKAMPLISKIKDELYPALPRDEDLGQASISLNVIECLPGELAIVPDRCILTIDRRTIPGEDAAFVKQEMDNLINELSLIDPEFKADAKVKSTIERSYTGIELEAKRDMNPWKISKEHGFTIACAEALKEVGQEVKFGYWDFGTDGSKTAGIDKKPTIGYSPMQEQYAHTPYDKVRTDYMEKGLEGNVAIFLKATGAGKDAFNLID